MMVHMLLQKRKLRRMAELKVCMLLMTALPDLFLGASS